jgi:hypothetical protein
MVSGHARKERGVRFLGVRDADTITDAADVVQNIRLCSSDVGNGFEGESMFGRGGGL